MFLFLADYDTIPESPKANSIRNGKGRLYHRVVLGSKGAGPSVPTKINENGYWLDHEGNLYRVSPDVHDTTLGPAFYHISEVSNW